MDNDTDNDFVENNIGFSVDFVYPSEGEETTQEVAHNSNELITKLSVYLLSAKEPKQQLCALLYSTNYDVGILLGCDNTLTAISKLLGLSKQSFKNCIKNVQLELNIKHTNTGMLKESSKVYKTANKRKLK
jgi:hypothetical protein